MYILGLTRHYSKLKKSLAGLHCMILANFYKIPLINQIVEIVILGITEITEK